MTYLPAFGVGLDQHSVPLAVAMVGQALSSVLACAAPVPQLREYAAQHPQSFSPQVTVP
jgi:hypothetical protein